jgi:glycosyltransferase involved in cell wall biosynthesis
MKPKLLFLCQLLPYPPDGGAPIRTYNILRLLAQEFDVTIFCFYRRSAVRDVDASVRHLSGIGVARAFRIDQEFSRARLLLDHARSLFTGRVYTAFAYESRHFRTALRRELRSTRFDLVHVDSLDLSGYLNELGDTPTVCVHHNVESQLLNRRAALEGKGFRGWYLARQATLMHREETVWAPRVSLNVTVSDDDRMLLRQIAPAANVCVVPNGVDADEFRPGSVDGQKGIIFVGGLTWFPNKDALNHFIEDIIPALRDRGVDEVATWVGRASETETALYRSKGVHLTGYVDDIRPLVLKAACFVVPLRVGGGTRLKILDAWAMGKAVVSTTVGCEGLDARDGWNILIRDDPKHFAEAVEQVLGDSQLRARLGANARLTVDTTYAWKIIGTDMLSNYRAALRTDGAIASASPFESAT